MCTNAGRKRKRINTEVESQVSPSTQLMAYILAQKEAEKVMSNSRSQNSEQHPVDTFLVGIARFHSSTCCKREDFQYSARVRVSATY